MLVILLHWLSAPALPPVAVSVPVRNRKPDR
jgi:hypothetical protein